MRHCGRRKARHSWYLKLRKTPAGLQPLSDAAPFPMPRRSIARSLAHPLQLPLRRGAIHPIFMKQLKHVLIVDDNADLRELFTESIGAYGYSVASVENGHEALLSLRENPAPTLVFLDLMMPKMTGWDFLRVFHSSPEFSAHSVVTTSAVNMDLSTDGQILPQTAGRLLKPVALNTILSVVEKFCGPSPLSFSSELRSI